MQAVNEGTQAPDFSLPTDGGGRIKLSDLRGQKVILYFYPQDDTETCALEAIDFSGSLPAFEATGAAVIGISPDTEKSHDRFKAKYKLGLTLASDPDRRVIEQYGVWVEKHLFGRDYMGVERSTFLIDPKGQVAKVWRKVRLRRHIEEVLAAAEAL